MRHDMLLAYLSEKGEGDWDDLRNAWRWLTGETRDPADQAWVVAQDLSALGHIEVAWGEKIQWCAAPPVLTMVPMSGGRALLTGGRTRHLYDPTGPRSERSSGTLMAAAEDLDLWVDEWRAADGPTTAMVACKSASDAETLAERLEVTFSHSVADQLSRMLPSLAAYQRHWSLGELPRGFDAEMFDVDTVRWVPAHDASSNGLYRCRTWQTYVHALRGPTGWYRLPREQGIYEVLRWKERRVIEYNHESYELVLPVAARFPVLYARAAILCSGRLPRFFRRGGEPWLAHPNVTPDVARRVATALGQRMEEHDE